MEKSSLQLWAEEIACENGFVVDKLIYSGEYYAASAIRNVILSGTFEGQPAVLKAYDDSRFTDEPLALARFNAGNKSAKLVAPRLYAHGIVSPKKGWFIMEKLPDNGRFFTPPLNKADRQRFIAAFIEYRLNFPYEPTRELSLAENLPADEFHIHRISGWFRLANDQEELSVSQGGARLLGGDSFIPKYARALDKLRRDFKGRQMAWCHGHTKPQEFYQAGDVTYLTDFAHTKLYPEGYELAFIIWADRLMAGDWNLAYEEWRAGVFGWIDDLEPVAEKIGIADYRNFIRSCLLERVLGTILADVCASDRPADEKTRRLNLLLQLLDELL